MRQLQELYIRLIVLRIHPKISQTYPYDSLIKNLNNISNKLIRQ